VIITERNWNAHIRCRLRKDQQRALLWAKIKRTSIKHGAMTLATQQRLKQAASLPVGILRHLRLGDKVHMTRNKQQAWQPGTVFHVKRQSETLKWKLTEFAWLVWKLINREALRTFEDVLNYLGRS
jgi:hypothetical protein